MTTSPNDDEELLLKKLAGHVRDSEGEDDAAALAALAGVKPFDDALADRLTAKILLEPSVVVPITAAKKKVGAGASAPKKSPFRWSIVPVAAAAAIGAVWVGGGFRQTTEGVVPGYDVAVISAKSMRSSSSSSSSDTNAPPYEGPSLVNPDGDFELIARPQKPITQGKVAARAVLVYSQEAPTPWSPPLDISSEGSVRIQGPTKKLFPVTAAAKDCDVVLLIASDAKALPSESEALSIAGKKSPSPASIRTVRTRIRFSSE